jgi:hypothetical protein
VVRQNLETVVGGRARVQGQAGAPRVASRAHLRHGRPGGHE